MNTVRRKATASDIGSKQARATEIVRAIRETMTDENLAIKLGISKVTLYTRLEKSNWKKGEMALINTFKL